MAGTREGGIKVRDKLKAENPNFYKELGAKGGKVAPGPFKNNKELARRAGRLGGLKRANPR